MGVKAEGLRKRGGRNLGCCNTGTALVTFEQSLRLKKLNWYVLSPCHAKGPDSLAYTHGYRRATLQGVDSGDEDDHDGRDEEQDHGDDPDQEQSSYGGDEDDDPQSTSEHQATPTRGVKRKAGRGAGAPCDMIIRSVRKGCRGIVGSAAWGGDTHRQPRVTWPRYHSTPGSLRA